MARGKWPAQTADGAPEQVPGLAMAMHGMPTCPPSDGRRTLGARMAPDTRATNNTTAALCGPVAAASHCVLSLDCLTTPTTDRRDRYTSGICCIPSRGRQRSPVVAVSVALDAFRPGHVQSDGPTKDAYSCSVWTRDLDRGGTRAMQEILSLNFARN